MNSDRPFYALLTAWYDASSLRNAPDQIGNKFLRGAFGWGLFVLQYTEKFTTPAPIIQSIPRAKGIYGLRVSATTIRDRKCKRVSAKSR